jgi:hypothetical protein
MVLPAALVTVFVGFAVGIPGFLAYAQSLGRQVGDLVVESSHEVNAGRMPEEAPAVAWFSIVLALPAFALLTPSGLFATYLVASGLFRLLSWAADDPRGDPLVDIGDGMVRRRRAESRRRRDQDARREQEGPEVEDVLVHGGAVGLPEAVYAVVSSRLKPGWDPGVFVLLADGGRYRLGERRDRRYRAGLRAVYPLLEVPSAEATRRRVAYALPPLSEWDAAAGCVRSAAE